jgi:MFS transporter, NNP family, nitrate/nitrite transporter
MLKKNYLPCFFCCCAVLFDTGAMVRKSSKKSAAMAYSNFNSWILAMQYAASLGMELTVTNTAATYFHDKFQLSTTTAGLIATLFGFMVSSQKLLCAAASCL